MTKVKMRAVQEKDLEVLLDLHHECLETKTVIELYNHEDQIGWYKLISNNPKLKRYSLINHEDEVIGIARVDNIDLINKNCELGIDILSSQRNKGYGYAAYKELLNFIFYKKNYDMVYMKYLDDNSKAENLYLKIGFRKTGFYSDAIYRNGVYINLNIVCLTRNEYEKNSI